MESVYICRSKIYFNERECTESVYICRSKIYFSERECTESVYICGVRFIVVSLILMYFSLLHFAAALFPQESF
jgi:hypothetical protein